MSRSQFVAVGIGTTLWCVAAGPFAVRADEPRQTPAPVPAAREAFKLPGPDLPALGPTQRSDDHPLRPVIQLAVDGFRRVRADVRDYTCIMVRRERVDGRLRPYEYIYAKVRHQQTAGDQVVIPFSVYLKFLKPASVTGREVLYVEGQNDGEMFARRGGTRFAFVTTRLRPESELAMRGNRYSITEFGLQNLLYRLLQSARRDLQTQCRVDYVPDAEINDRPARGIIVTHVSPQESPNFYQARIFVDKQLELPVHYEAYDWPEQPGKDPEVIEQYTYTQLELNPGLTDADFSADNPQYKVK